MKLVLIGVAVLLLLGGGGAGAYFYFGSQSAEASAGEMAEHEAAADAHGKSEDSHGDGHGGGDVAFVEMSPMILPIIDEQGVSQVVTLVIVLEASDAAAAEELKLLEPRLKDAYIQDMYGVLNRKASMQGGVIRVDQLKARLNRVSTRVLGEGKVNDVLLQVVQQRPI